MYRLGYTFVFCGSRGKSASLNTFTLELIKLQHASMYLTITDENHAKKVAITCSRLDLLGQTICSVRARHAILL